MGRHLPLEKHQWAVPRNHFSRGVQALHWFAHEAKISSQCVLGTNTQKSILAEDRIKFPGSVRLVVSLSSFREVTVSTVEWLWMLADFGDPCGRTTTHLHRANAHHGKGGGTKSCEVKADRRSPVPTVGHVAASGEATGYSYVFCCPHEMRLIPFTSWVFSSGK